MTSYRTSHSSPGYGEVYARTYKQGYYADQWRMIEAPLLKGILSDLQKANPNQRYLDFACGTGRILKLAESCFDDCTGVDLSAAMLTIARQECVKARILERDITKQPLDERFDVITAFRFFLNAEPSLTDAVLKQMHQLLNDEGVLILNIHVNASSPLGIFYGLRAKFQHREWDTRKSLPAMQAALEKNGFEIDKIHWYGYLPRPGWKFQKTAHALMMPVENICRRLPFLKSMAQCFLLECRKTR